jgi:hypothetical protein
MARPRPPVVTPPAQTLPVPPPSDAVVLFDGKGLAEFTGMDGKRAAWKVENGVLTVAPGTGALVSRKAFGDVQVHMEWASPAPATGKSQGRGNSGIHLMGLYEVQVLDSYRAETYADGQAAAIYGQYPPLVNACRPPGEWQSYDITFRRPRFDSSGKVLQPARVSVIHNGILVQDNVEILGPTIWLHYQPYRSHADRLPFSLQEHGHPVRYRNIWVRELTETTPVNIALEPRAKLKGIQAKRYVGTYRAQMGGGEVDLLVRQEGGRFYFDIPFRGQSFELVPHSPRDFSLRTTDAHLLFDLDPSGNATGFGLSVAGDISLGAKRKP